MAAEMKKPAHHQLTDEELKQIVAEADTGGRKPTGAVATAMLITALCWSLFQVWIASPAPFTFGIFVFNDTESRSIHLAFAVFLAFLAYPFSKSSHASTCQRSIGSLRLSVPSAPPICSSSIPNWRHDPASPRPWTLSWRCSAWPCCWKRRAGPSAFRW